MDWNSTTVHNLTTMALVRKPRHPNVMIPDIAARCHIVFEFFETTDDACRYVRYAPKCREVVNHINYLEFMVCTLKVDNSISGALTIMLFVSTVVVVYFTMLIILVRYFTAPNFIALSEPVFKVNFDLGVFLLSLIFALPHLVGYFFDDRAFLENGSMVFSELLAEVVGCFIVSLIVLSNKYVTHLDVPRAVVQFAMLFISTLIVVESLKFDLSNKTAPAEERVNFDLRIPAAISVVLYVLYTIGMCVWRRPRVQGTPVDLEMDMTQRSPEPRDVQPVAWNGYLEKDAGKMNAIISTVYALNPHNYITSFSHFIVSLTVPIFVILGLLLPVVDTKRPLNGWNQPISCISILCFPFFIIMFDVPWKFYIFGGLMAVSVLSVVLILVLTRNDKVPKGHYFFAALGTFFNFTLFGVIDAEMDTMMFQLLGYLNNWKDDAVVLGIFPLACILKLYLIVLTFAELGYWENGYGIMMGINICYLSLLPALLVFRLYYTPTEQITVTGFTTNTYIFWLVVLSMTLIALLLTDFELRYCNAVFAILFGLVYITNSGLCFTNLIHAYGSHHGHGENQTPENTWA